MWIVIETFDYIPGIYIPGILPIVRLLTKDINKVYNTFPQGYGWQDEHVNEDGTVIRKNSQAGRTLLIFYRKEDK